jgi:two-component system, LuxR family, sensor kinase FixL
MANDRELNGATARRRRPRGALAGAAVAISGFALAFALRHGLEPWLGGRAPLLIFVIPVLGCALLCGAAPAVLVAALAVALGAWEFSQDGALETADLVHLGAFAAVSACAIILARVALAAKAIEENRRESAQAAARAVESATRELERRERHLRSILETVPDAMIVIDDGGRIVSFSAAAQKMFGFSEAELLGENVSVLMPSPDRERHNGYMERYQSTGERKIIGIGRVTTARRRDGGTFPIHLHVGETRVGNERLFTGFIEDLTERQETELKLHDLQAELAHVSRVTAMGTLATSLAHELNQPLTAIANYVETAHDLLADPSPQSIETVQEALAECAAQSVRAGQIVRRLRDFISRGEIERRVESLGRLISEASALALVGAGERGIEFEVRLAPGADRVLVDRIQIQQVLLNLIRNAVQAMSGCIDRRLEISSVRREGMVEVVIADSGPGLPPDVAEHLFQPFVSTKAEGMGLGLSICHTIIGGHGGRIWAEPSPFGGAAFHFTLIDADQGHDHR